jgi:hypothetical protein
MQPYGNASPTWNIQQLPEKGEFFRQVHNTATTCHEQFSEMLVDLPVMKVLKETEEEISC